MRTSILRRLVAPAMACLALVAADCGGDESTSSPSCAAGTTSCNGSCVDTNRDRANCGACGAACSPGQICDGAGQCADGCSGGLTECTGVCVDTNTDSANCGSCGTACMSGEICNGSGTCDVSCQAGLTECNGVCVDTNLSNQHCGACASECESGKVCDGSGQCALSCQFGLTNCNGVCVDFNVSNQHCGVCNNVCPSGQVCNGMGQCAVNCQASLTNCDGVCTDLDVSNQHCGNCNSPCSQGQVCNGMGQCALSCGGGTTLCSNNCVDTQVDAANCGGCGMSCMPGLVCSMGMCQLQCGGGTTLCNNSCVDTMIDPNNCGGCSVMCVSGEVCSGGACVMQCNGGACSPGEHLWSKHFSAPDTRGYSVALDSADNVVLSGIFGGTVNFGGGPLTSLGSWDTYVTKLTPNGQYVWSQAFGSPAEEHVRQIVVDGTDAILLAGYFSGTVNFGGGPLSTAGSWDMFVAKLTPNGTHVWSKRFGGTANDFVYEIAVDASNNVLLTGHFQNTIDFGGGPLASAGDYDGFIAKLDGAGNHLWSKRFGNAARQDGYAIAADGGGNVIGCGYFQGSLDLGGGTLTSVGTWDNYLVKYDAQGNHQFSSRQGSNDARCYRVALDGQNNIVLSGIFQGTINYGGGPLISQGSWDAFLAKLSPAGSHIWSKRFGDANDTRGYGIAVDGGGNVISAGYFQGTVDLGGGALLSAGSWDIYLAKLDGSGNHLWSTRFGAGNDEFFEDVTVGSLNRIVTAGEFQTNINFGGATLVHPVGGGTYAAFVAAFAP